jgi:hypothetical protein
MTTAAIATRKETRVFRPVVVLLLLLAGVFSFSAYFVLQAYAPDLKGGDDGGAHALSRSAVGFAGLVSLLRADGVPVLINRDGPAKRDPHWGLLVLTPEESTKPSDLSDFTAAAGPTLVVLPKWETTPDPLHSGWVRNAGLIDPDALKGLLGKPIAATISRRADTGPVRMVAVGAPAPAAFSTGPIAQLQTLTAPGVTTVMTDQSGAAMLVKAPGSTAEILADPDLLNTHGLRDPATARAAVALIGGLRQDDGPVVFDVSLDGLKHSPSLLKLAFEPPFLGATLCLIGAALLMAVHAANRFGAPERAVRALALGKRALAENSAGLIRMARREPRMAGGYLDLNRNAVAKALGATRLSAAELEAYVDRLGERAGAGRLSAIAQQMPAVRDRDSLIRFAQRLYQWRLEMTRERR